jgi:hypothetical protein
MPVPPSSVQHELARIIFPHIKYVNPFAYGGSAFLTKHAHSRSVNIEHHVRITNEAISLLVEFLRALPNLASLRIYNVHSEASLPFFYSAFTGVSLPSVTTLAVPDKLHPIFPTFPNVTLLRCPMTDERTMLVAKAKLRRLDTVAGLRMYRREEATLAGAYPLSSLLQPMSSAHSARSPLAASSRRLRRKCLQ